MALPSPSTLTALNNPLQPALVLGNTLDSSSRSRWDWSKITESLWSAAYPYQLAILSAQPDGKNYLMKDSYVLPINPESLTNAMPFATTLQATVGGVVENNGGVPLRQITFSGNMGVINHRDNSADLVNFVSQIGGILGGPLTPTQTASSLLGTVLNPNLYPAAVPGATSGIPDKSSGYFQWLLFQQFMESYAEVKKTQAGETIRLALFVWKEQSVWLISPEVLQLNRSKDQPVEYTYNFRCTAYSRISPQQVSTTGADGSPFSLVSVQGALSALKNVQSNISAATAIITKLKNLPAAINADFEQTVGGTIRSVGLLVADAVGATKTWSMFPASIQNTAYGIINANAPLYTNLINSSPSRAPSSTAKITSLTVDTSSIANTPVNSLTAPTPALLTAMSKEVARVRALTTNDFLNMRTQVETFNSQLSAAVGLPDPRNPNPPTPIRTATNDDILLITAFAQVSDAISQLVVIQQQQENQNQTSVLDYVAGLASTAGINFRTALSKFAVPFPYGGTLEGLALQYLGDATRWGEIAALNELRQPYVDEVGQNQLLLANGKGNNIVIADGSMLQINHSINISSKTQLTQNLIVLNIQELATGYWSITLSGPPTLSNFTLADQATIQYFLPGTVRSSQVVFIPSDTATTNPDFQFRYVPTLSDLEKLLQVGGIDGALTSSGDIAITADGDWPYVQGLAALIQWARVALNTPLGSWTLYPTFGLDIAVGQSIADISAQDILASIKNSFNLNSAFTGVNSALINVDGPATTITLEFGVQGVNSLLPVTFQIAE